jgi:hypothetical protein
VIRARTALPVALLLAGFLAGCGGDGEGGGGSAQVSSAADEQSGEKSGGERVGTPETVDCPGDAQAVDLSVDFPAPLPEGTVVVAVEDREGDRTVVTGVVPATEKDVLAELQQAFPAAGLTLTEGETEEQDAESNFEGQDAEGHAVVGRWGIRVLPDCTPEATRIDVVVRTS